jgi:hypothetical protein
MGRDVKVFVLLMLLAGVAYADEARRQFIFAWPLDEKALKPRGATTRGAPVTLDTAPSEAWRRLNEPGLSPKERDRRAILAMAGPYRVSFDFLEVVRYDAALKPDAPYQSWGTEYVFVADDRQGLLYVITRTIFELGLSVHAARVSTRLDQVADVFYVTDLDGVRPEDPSRLEHIRATIKQEIDRFLQGGLEEEKAPSSSSV